MSSAQESDLSGLINDLRSNKREAVEYVFNTHYDHFVNYARSRMGNCQAAADGTDAAMSAIRTFYRRFEEGQYDQLRTHTEMIKLLMVIVLRKSLRYVAKNQRISHQGTSQTDERWGQGPVDNYADDATDAEQLVFVQETVDQLLKGLKDEASKRICLLQIEGYPTTQIAEMVGMSTRNVQRKMERSREVLQSIVDHEERV